jgi:hypothetical protein
MSAKETAEITPLKGESYTTGVHGLLSRIALGLGDEYADTGDLSGAILCNKKGNGRVDDQTAALLGSSWR